MCIAAVFKIAQNCKQLKCSTGKGIKTNCYHPYSRMILSNKMEGANTESKKPDIQNHMLYNFIIHSGKGKTVGSENISRVGQGTYTEGHEGI